MSLYTVYIYLHSIIVSTQISLQHNPSLSALLPGLYHMLPFERQEEGIESYPLFGLTAKEEA